MKFVPSVERSIFTPVWLAALFCHDRLICDAETTVVLRLLGGEEGACGTPSTAAPAQSA